jgi:hypothetical protein
MTEGGDWQTAQPAGRWRSARPAGGGRIFIGMYVQALDRERERRRGELLAGARARREERTRELYAYLQPSVPLPPSTDTSEAAGPEGGRQRKYTFGQPPVGDKRDKGKDKGGTTEKETEDDRRGAD